MNEEGRRHCRHRLLAVLDQHQRVVLAVTVEAVCVPTHGTAFLVVVVLKQERRAGEDSGSDSEASAGQGRGAAHVTWDFREVCRGHMLPHKEGVSETTSRIYNGARESSQGYWKSTGQGRT